MGPECDQEGCARNPEVRDDNENEWLDSSPKPVIIFWTDLVKERLKMEISATKSGRLASQCVLETQGRVRAVCQTINHPSLGEAFK